MSPLKEWKIEHVVIDDASTDETADLFLDQQEGLSYIRLDQNVGAAAARNVGIREARGDYIFVLDADDVLLQRSLHNMLSVILNTDCQWVCADMLRVNDDLSYCVGDDYYGWVFDDIDQMLTSILKGEHFIQHNVLFAKSLFERVGGYDESISMAEDLDLFVRFLLAGEMPEYSPIVSHLHRVHHDNVSRDIDINKHMQDVERLRDKYKKQLMERGIVL